MSAAVCGVLASASVSSDIREHVMYECQLPLGHADGHHFTQIGIGGYRYEELFDALYHVPRSQVWQGSGGRQAGHVHLHVREQFDLGRIHRAPGEALCGRRGWYERAADGEGPCPRCAEIAARIPSSAGVLT